MTDPTLLTALAILALLVGAASAVAFRRALAASARRCREWHAEASADEPAAVLGGGWTCPAKVEASPAPPEERLTCDVCGTPMRWNVRAGEWRCPKCGNALGDPAPANRLAARIGERAALHAERN